MKGNTMENIKQNLPLWGTIWAILGFGWGFDLSIPVTNMAVIIIILFMIPVYKAKDAAIKEIAKETIGKYNPDVDIPEFLKK